MSENGFIRTLSLSGEPEAIGRLATRLEQNGVDKAAWYLSGKKDQLFFHEALWGNIDLSVGKLQASYSEAILSPSISYRYSFREVQLNHSRKIYIERRALCSPQTLEEADRMFFENSVLHINNGILNSDVSIKEDILDFEMIQPGLQDYF
jgi:hypothetical protein